MYSHFLALVHVDMEIAPTYISSAYLCKMVVIVRIAMFRLDFPVRLEVPKLIFIFLRIFFSSVDVMVIVYHSKVRIHKAGCAVEVLDTEFYQLCLIL